jgi:SAM-dependent methyltransferase
MGTAPRDPWAGGNRYESYVGRWSRLVAREFVPFVGVGPGARWLDVGCGTGALSTAVLELCAPSQVVGVDPSPDFLARAAATVADPRATFRAGDAQHLPVDDGTFDSVVSALVLNFVPDAGAALDEMRRASRPGGVVAAYVWDYAEGMQFIRAFWNAAAAHDPAAADHDEGARFPLCRPEPLARLWQAAGLVDVDVRAVVVPTVFRDFDDCWRPFLGGTGSAPAYVASLGAGQVRAVRRTLHERLPVRPDGSVGLTARAWAVRGVVGHAGS